MVRASRKSDGAMQVVMVLARKNIIFKGLGFA